ncbi:hypothetical protein LEP1GSC021_0108 [Leptospira noguchii str. 1993005606]|nr:hypothetical protein LEP1GSC021_0108 [Leptospira noguchii str. 1993005606]
MIQEGLRKIVSIHFLHKQRKKYVQLLKGAHVFSFQSTSFTNKGRNPEM